MRLKLEDLRQVMKQAIDEEKAVDVLREEVARVLGPSVVVDGKVEQLAEAANYRLDVMERTGRSGGSSVKPAAIVGFMQHQNPEVRKLAARMVPVEEVTKMANDKNSGVRAAVAKRLPLNAVREMLKKFGHDDELRIIYKRRKLEEAGIKQPKVQDEPFDMHGEERLGDAVKQSENPDLSEQWYKDKAFKFLQDYGTNIEYQWEEILARRYVSSVRATSLVEVDEAKLLKAIKEAIKDKEDRVLERDALKETLDWLHVKDERALLNESVMPLEEDNDPVRELVESGLSPQEYVEQADKLFKVQSSTLPSAIRKYRLGEENRRSETVPMIGRLPHNKGFRRIDEQALDRYVTAWNDRQMMQGEPLKLVWTNHPDAIGKIGFSVTLR